MRLGLHTQCLIETHRGVGFYTLALLEALKAQNLEITCFHAPGNHPSISDVDHHLFRKPLPVPFSHSAAALLHSSCFEKVDLFHFPVPKVLYGRRPKVPIVITIHDIMALRFPKLFPKSTRLMMSHFLPRYLREADIISVVSTQTKLDLLDMFPLPQEKIVVIPPPLLPRHREITLEKEPYFFYIGSFEPRKNLPRIIEAFALLKSREKIPHKLILAGGEEGVYKIPWDLIHKHNLQDEVIHKGYISEEEKAYLFQHAALLLWPSLYEGFGLPLLEAMASGTPIVTSDLSSIPEVVGDAAECVDPTDIDQIADACWKILSSEEHAQILIKRGLERATNFTLEGFGKAHLELYQTVLGGNYGSLCSVSSDSASP